jgi:N6-L-threonylcarbamoyladenine synthase
MLILAIETSCDETAASVVEAVGDFPAATYTVRGNALLSQAKLHSEYGGVFPTLAKREHIAAILPILKRALGEAKLPLTPTPPSNEEAEMVRTLLAREGALADELLAFAAEHGLPKVELIAVTSGPGLEPALWVGVNFAKTLAYLTRSPLIAADHMEGHALVSLFDGRRLAEVPFPAVALLVSGGHTELILMRGWGRYELIGATRDDAAGEAFDKVARLLGLPYPGGPEVSRRASEARAANLPPFAALPRPMLASPDLDFSFSGLKTAVRYAVGERKLSAADSAALARDFEDAVVEVLIAKLARAVERCDAKSVVLGGGVAANRRLRAETAALASPKRFPGLAVFLPQPSLTTDNSVMIALAGHARLKEALPPAAQAGVRADGNRALARA